jgi:hypothetical protein
VKKTLHFLSGIPRSGFTVLAAILNQNPMLHVSTTSGMMLALDSLANSWKKIPLLNKNDHERKNLAQIMRVVIDAFYENKKAPVIIDKSRGWPIPEIMHSMCQVLNKKPKIKEIKIINSFSKKYNYNNEIINVQNLDKMISYDINYDNLTLFLDIYTFVKKYKLVNSLKIVWNNKLLADYYYHYNNIIAFISSACVRMRTRSYF